MIKSALFKNIHNFIILTRLTGAGIYSAERFGTVKDYIPRKFGFSIGFDCVDVSQKSLKGTKYYLEVHSLTNETSCLPVPETSVNCSRFYSLASSPNLLGQNIVLALYWIEYLFEVLDSFKFPLDCYVYLEEFACNIYFPKCDSESQTITVPCRETFEELHKGCATSSAMIENLVNTFFDSYYNEYLPPQDGNIPCFYKPVICGPPPNATDTVITGGLNESGIYYGGSELQYSCADESLAISGNNTVTCLYSGFWSPLPVCVKPNRKNLLVILLPAISFGLCVVVVIIIVIICVKRRKKAAPNLPLTRRRECDAYLCYDFDGNHDFVMDTILPAFEENQDPSFKLCIHSRDFEPGISIFENIQKAISLSNSAIIIMSQEFVSSLWCKKEFEQCFIENMNDPAFKLFLIMMQPADTLEHLTEYMTSFISQKTYLERDDPDLIEKISDYLKRVKQPKGDDGNNDDEQIENNVVVTDPAIGLIELADMGHV